MKSVKCVVFDAYGTLFDVQSLVAPLERRFPLRGSELNTAWRARQLEYTWLHSLMNRYEDFWKVTESALIATCNAKQLALDPATRTEVMEAYLRLAPFPDVKETLSSLSGVPLAILSNGNARMLEELLKNSGLEGAFSHVISVDEVKTYKPSPAAYQLAANRMRLEANSIGFASSNFFDVAGAKAFGFRTYWVNRTAIPAEELNVTPDATLSSLTSLVDFFKDAIA